MSTCIGLCNVQKGVDLEQFVHEYYSVNRFRAAYGRQINTLWPHIDQPFGVGAPLTKLSAGRMWKLRIKGWDEGGRRRKENLPMTMKVTSDGMRVKVTMKLFQQMQRDKR